MDKSLMLDPGDFVGVSFWIISAAMVAATFFFFMERDRAVGKWKTSLSVAALVTGIAAMHYFYMRGVWVETGESPTVFRYVDWLLTVPLQITEFYLILAAVTAVAVALFWRLLIYRRHVSRGIYWRGRRSGLERSMALLYRGAPRLAIHRVRNLYRRGE